MRGERIGVHVFCALVALVALAAAGWAVISGQVAEQGIDAIFLLFFCLLAAVVFGAIPVMAYRQGLFKDLLKRRAGKQPPEPRAETAMAAKSQERAE